MRKAVQFLRNWREILLPVALEGGWDVSAATRTLEKYVMINANAGRKAGRRAVVMRLLLLGLPAPGLIWASQASAQSEEQLEVARQRLREAQGQDVSDQSKEIAIQEHSNEETAAEAGFRISAIGKDTEHGLKLLDIDFKGGTLAEWYAGLRQVEGGLTVVTPPQAEQVELPPIRLHGVQVYSAIALPGKLIPGITISDVGSAYNATNAAGKPLVTSPIWVVQLHPDLLAQQSGSDFSFSFPGGTVAEYIDAIREASGQSRVVIMPGAGVFHMPAVQLSGVSMEEAVQAIYVAKPANESGQELYVEDPGNIFIIALGEAPDSRSDNMSIYVQSVAEILATGEISVEAILSAVETLLSLDADGEHVIRYHQDTQLLMVRASQEQLQHVYELLSRIEESASQMQQRKTGQPPPPANLQRKMRPRLPAQPDSGDDR